MQQPASETNDTIPIVQLCLPHYRIPFYLDLTEKITDRLLVVAGPYNFGGTPLSVAETPGVRRVNIHNRFMLKYSFVVQHPLPPVVFHSRVAVLEFNPRILTTVSTLVRRKQAGRATILWGHGLSYRRKTAGWVRKLRAWMAQRADAAIFFDTQGKQDFIDLGVPAEKLFVAYNSIDVQGIRRLAAKHQAERKHILFVGRLLPGKNVDLLLDGFLRALGNLPPETKLIIIGDGPERTNLRAQTEAAGAGARVELPGEITEEAQLAPYFAQSMLAVYPSGVGLFAIHSLAYGVPMLLADVKHKPEAEIFVRDRNCAFFAPDDPQALAAQLQSLLAQPDKLQAMGQAGIEDVTARYSVQRMSDVFVQAFDYALSGSMYSHVVL